jgi:GDP-mannose 6-dehydrogenase
MTNSKPRKISIFGLGYVGTVSAACLAKDGHRVIGVDPNPTKVDLINQGKSPIIEKDIGELVESGVKNELLSAVVDPAFAVAETDISLICVGTPSQRNGSLDLTYVASVCREIGEELKKKRDRHIVILRSTTLPGSMRETVIPALESASGLEAGDEFGVCNNPEFLREGTAVYDYYHPPKIVIGELKSGDGDVLAELYRDLDAPMVRASVDTAEMVKYVDNVWHALKVSFANEIGNICKQLNLDGQEVMNIFCKDEKLNLSPYYLRPGFAFGGSCLPKDLRALNYKATQLDVEVPVLRSITVSNQLQVKRGIELVQQAGNKKVGVLGFSFKSGTDDLRESPVIELIEFLLGKGCELSIYDNNVNISRLVGANRDYILKHIPHIADIMVDSIDSILESSDTIVIGNGSGEFRDIAERVRPDQKIVDLVGVAKPSKAMANYEGIGW